MRNITMRQAEQAVRGIHKVYPDADCKILDWRDTGEGIKILPQGIDPYTVSMNLSIKLPKGTFLEPGYGSLGLYWI